MQDIHARTHTNETHTHGHGHAGHAGRARARAHTHKMEGSGEVSIQNSFVALPAPPLVRWFPRGPRGALSQLYMQMHPHLGNSTGMLGPGSLFMQISGRQSQHTTQEGRPQTPMAVSPDQHNT